MKAIIEIRKTDGVVIGSRSWDDDSGLPADTDDIEYADMPPSMAGASFMRQFRRLHDGSFEEFTPRPTEHDILAVRFNELCASDWTAAADREPMPEWIAYRKALRDITADGKDVVSMMAAFPKRPDGTDPVEKYR